ncbi:hypothetical protein XcuCFBP2542_16380 [Xanthomonas cucurbitae]|uniref:Uncharacterized protein n=1 Tax=Xanthomonas cucurbitae TaxID=56453 RepID=A0A2S7DIH0_9XANT|nr:hypothetical protein XcuCFBP2542_16380 [Xanthomonas cucurbitae]QHG85764.1 hypothetical protein EBN15_00985 [Xanthomonas cucurbitae]
MPFQVGFSNASASGADDTAVQGKRDFGIDVNWPLTDNAWTDTNQDVKSTAAISRYALGPNGGGTWAYILHFSNTEHYNYYFSDKTGDGYQVNTFRNGDHYVRYNSSDPAITFIKGS